MIVGYFPWRVIFFLNIPIGLLGLYLVYRHLPDYRAESVPPLDFIGMVLFGSGIALLSYVLEVFGEHSMSGREIAGLLALALLLLATYGRHAMQTAFPLLRLTLFRLGTLRAAVLGGFVTRIGIGGIPFLFPLLYQVGLGFTPIQSGLLMMPQAAASIGLKLTVTGILTRFGYRAIFISNTVILGPAHLAVCHHRRGHAGLAHRGPILLLRVLCFPAVFEHEHSGLCRRDRGRGQQCQHHRQHPATNGDQFRRGLILAGRGAFHSRSVYSSPPEMIHGIHRAFLVLGGMTILSTIVFQN